MKIAVFPAFAIGRPAFFQDPANPGVDKVAAYGIAALIGGKVAAKVGLLAKQGSLPVVFKKVIIMGFLAVATLFSKLFKRHKAQTPA